MPTISRTRRGGVSVAIAFALTLAACSSGGGSNSGGGSGEDDVADTLKNLKVDTAETPRVDKNDDPLPDSFAPLGARKTLSKNSEIFLAGLPMTTAEDFVNVIKFEPGISNVPGVADHPDRTAKLPDAPLDTTWKSQPYSASAAGDIDGDGLEEMVLLWWDATDEAVRLEVVDDQTESFVESPVSVLTTVATPSWLRVICGDFNGDGTDEIAVAIVDDTAGTVKLEFLEGSKSSSFSIDASREKTYAGSQAAGTSQLNVELAVGQLDLDAAQEIGVVTSETWGSGTNSSPGNGISQYYIYDDRGTDFKELTKGRVAGDVDTATYNAVTATIAIGDVDGDGMDEVVLAGLTSFSVTCEPLSVIQFVLDDAPDDFANLGTDYNEEQRPSGCETSGNNGWTSHIWANTLDIDGDQYDEIQVNGIVYEDFAHAAKPWDVMMVETADNSDSPVPAIIPFEYMFKDGAGNNARAKIKRDSLVMAAADVTADGKADILVYTDAPVATGSESSSSSSYLTYARAVTIWGFDAETGQWGKRNLIGSNYPSNGLLYAEVLANESPVGPPMVVPVNVDNDSTMLKFSEGSHRIVFTEPIVHAVLAAPPCYNDGTQVTDDCRTSWGTGNSTGLDASVSHEISVSYHTGVSGGVSVPNVASVNTEVEQSVGVSLKAEASYGYQLTKTVTYTTGPMEDTVVATVIPYDQYTYKILSHPVFPELVGKDLVVSLPRSARTMQIDRQFYNESLVGVGAKIDSAVLNHTVGDPTSYPTRSEMLAKSDAKSIGPKDIGASLGNQSVSISESQVAGLTATVGLSFETTVKTTRNLELGAFSVGSSNSVSVGNKTELSLGFNVGTSVTYTGTVGDMPPATFDLDHAYSFGMFVYQQKIGTDQRPADVINYWVE